MGWEEHRAKQVKNFPSKFDPLCELGQLSLTSLSRVLMCKMKIIMTTLDTMYNLLMYGGIQINSTRKMNKITEKQI